MIISDNAVKKSVTVMVLAVIIIVFGVYSYMVLPRESDPDITIPYVFVSTSYKGVSPTDIETSIPLNTAVESKPPTPRGDHAYPSSLIAVRFHSVRILFHRGLGHRNHYGTDHHPLRNL